jgi:hypothetical protein
MLDFAATGVILKMLRRRCSVLAKVAPDDYRGFRVS